MHVVELQLMPLHPAPRAQMQVQIGRGSGDRNALSIRYGANSTFYQQGAAAVEREILQV
jgi:hypothetical protein